MEVTESEKQQRDATVIQQSSDLNCINSEYCEPESLLYSGGSGLRYTSTGSLVVYTDGSCLSNGRLNPLAAIGIYFGPECPLNLSRRLPDIYNPSNNTAEIVAVITVLHFCKVNRIWDVEIRTDSQYLISCVLQHMETWKLNGWIKTNGKPVVNASELKELSDAMREIRVKFVHVTGHAHDEGNRCADFLARMATINQFIERQNFEPFRFYKNSSK